MIELLPVTTRREKRLFLTFPWRIYKGDPLWVPPILSERKKVIDPARGLFFKDGTAEFFIAWKDGKPAGTLCLAEDYNFTRTRGFPECMYNFVEVVEDYSVFEAMFDFATDWARERDMKSLYGPYNLDREDSAVDCSSMAVTVPPPSCADTSQHITSTSSNNMASKKTAKTCWPTPLTLIHPRPRSSACTGWRNTCGCATRSSPSAAQILPTWTMKLSASFICKTARWGISLVTSPTHAMTSRP